MIGLLAQWTSEHTKSVSQLKGKVFNDFRKLCCYGFKPIRFSNETEGGEECEMREGREKKLFRLRLRSET